jgi:cell division septation protein DedD
VHITIEIDAAPEQLLEELASLRDLLDKINGPVPLTAPTEAPAETPAPKAKTPPPPPAPKAKAKAAEPAPEPEEAAEEAGEDDAVARAIALATDLVSKKKTAEIKTAMESVGATKVSDMTAEQALGFIAAVELL